MILSSCLHELRNKWLPHITNGGLHRLIELLEKNSPYLIHGSFSGVLPRGCLATHIAWHHPRTAHLDEEAGIRWLSKVAGLNPGTSEVIRTWDEKGVHDLELRAAILEVLYAERDSRCSANKQIQTCQLVEV